MNVRCIWEHNGEDTLLYAEESMQINVQGLNVVCKYSGYEEK